jgi:hypothetical protein
MLRLFFLSMDTAGRADAEAAAVQQPQGVRRRHAPLSGVGEFATSWPLFGNAPPTN